MKRLIAACLMTLFAAPALSESHAGPRMIAAPTGDAAAGEKAFRKCQACHVVANAEGEVLAGKRAKAGPNLFGVAGQVAGTVEGYKYSRSMIAASEAGLAWNEDSFVAYVMDPTNFLRANLDDPKARGKMTYKERNAEAAADVWAFLVSLDPDVEVGEDAATN